ncbi:MAG TPA: hypothetical protein VF692_15230 [Pyrinomonadaceae bacterium]
MTRRAWLTKSFRAVAAFGLGAVTLNAAGDLNPFVANAMNDLTAGSLNYAGTDSCVLTCQTTEGPCYYNGNLVRRDITEGIAGMPAHLAFRVVNYDTCQPMANASVEIRHSAQRKLFGADYKYVLCGRGDARASFRARHSIYRRRRLGIFRFHFSRLVFRSRDAHSRARQSQFDNRRHVAIFLSG